MVGDNWHIGGQVFASLSINTRDGGGVHGQANKSENKTVCRLYCAAWRAQLSAVLLSAFTQLSSFWNLFDLTLPL